MAERKRLLAFDSRPSHNCAYALCLGTEDGMSTLTHPYDVHPVGGMVPPCQKETSQRTCVLHPFQPHADRTGNGHTRRLADTSNQRVSTSYKAGQDQAKIISRVGQRCCQGVQRQLCNLACTIINHRTLHGPFSAYYSVRNIYVSSCRG